MLFLTGLAALESNDIVEHSGRQARILRGPQEEGAVQSRKVKISAFSRHVWMVRVRTRETICAPASTLSAWCRTRTATR